ncbi:MAG TPA: aspartate kinase [Flavobacteriaceae bacterium]|nr:aspartate kinase [Flavobacteriaceae bacterium]
MQVLKFGGTSVGSASRFKSIAQLLDPSERQIIVLSAMSGTTNSLVEIASYLYSGKSSLATNLIKGLRARYYKTVEDLYDNPEVKKMGKEMVDSSFNNLLTFTRDTFKVHEEKTVLAQGELLSTSLFQLYLTEIGVQAKLLPALQFMRIDKDLEPDYYYIKESLNRLLNEEEECNLFITQGFICRNVYGEIDNLKRGGSDYSASLIAVAAKADEVQIWTDINGLHNNDPRIVEGTKSIKRLSFDEAAELAYFGAKVLHPSSVLPAKDANIPVRLKSTLSPNAEGTVISAKAEGAGIKAIAAKDGICAIKIKSGRMLLAYGFMRKVFEIFELYKTSIDMITTSEVAVSVTIDDTTYLDEICLDLQKYGSVEVDKSQSIICVVGDFIQNDKGVALKVFEALRDVPIRMISYGGSEHNVSLLVNTADKKKALINLNKLFD